MARFDFFQNLFVQICVPTLVSLVPSRAQRALSIAKKNFQKYPPFPPKTPKNCQKRSKKRAIFRKTWADSPVYHSRWFQRDSRSSSTSSVDSNQKKSTLVPILTPKIAQNHPNHPKITEKPRPIRLCTFPDDSNTDSRSSSTSSIDSNQTKIALVFTFNP